MKDIDFLDLDNLQHNLLAITIDPERDIEKTHYEQKRYEQTHYELTRYEQTRSSWKVSLARANEAEYVLSLTRGIVKAIYQVDNKGWQPSPEYEGRYYFDGTEITDPKITNLYLGKKIERKKGNASPFQYFYKENSMPTQDIIDEKNIQNIVKENIISGVSQIILTGAPGTGKTYTAKSVANTFNSDKAEAGQDILTGFVQFHPSYDYTDFVEGLRPVSDGHSVSFKKLDGIFKKFCRDVVAKNTAAKNDKTTKYFFIIDEINRADLSNVLGELMFCLESDKRGQNNRVQTQYSNVPTWDIEKNTNLDDDCFKDGFYIPKNVVIIGTMNDIDRSVESFDFALRRRFTWIEVKVTDSLLKSALNAKSFKLKDNAHIIEKLISRIGELNKIINIKGKDFGLNKHYFISQGYFKDIPTEKKKNVDTLCQYVWEYRLKNLLEEYVRGESQVKIQQFIDDCEVAFLQKKTTTGKMAVDEQARESAEQGQ